MYGLAGRVVSEREFTGTSPSRGDLNSYTNFYYENKSNRLSFVQFSFPAGYQSFGYRYGDQSKGEMADQVYGLTWNGEELIQNSYDGFGRLANKKINNLDNKFTYQDVGTDKTSTLVKSVETANGTYTYTYDKLGNIVAVNDGQFTTSYEYDSLNQLVRENDQRAGKTYTYSYKNGNITSRNEYAYTVDELGEIVDTKIWTYGDSSWADLLTEFNGEQITYDNIGNPLTIGSKQLTWLGRQLQSITDGDNVITYEYNGDGQRIAKTVNGVKTEYFHNGDMFAAQRTGDTTLKFMSDGNGNLFGFALGQTLYFYIKNAQNDVVALADRDGNIVANYYYDAWGKLIDVTGDTDLATLNPIRYRSYYFDEETGWYYLKSRYYNADWCRFINTDKAISGVGGIINGYNLFSYCFNNPVNLNDESGNWPKASKVLLCVGVAVSAVAGVAAAVAFAPALVTTTGVIITSSVIAASANVAVIGSVVGSTLVTASLVAKVVEDTNFQGPIRDQSVYIMRDKTTNDVKYVGRTNSPSRRQKEHSRDGKKQNLQPLEVKFSGLTKVEARIMEQILISTYSLEYLDNARREIAVGNINAYSGKMDNIISIYGGVVESEILSLLER